MDVSKFNLLGDTINVKDAYYDRRFILLGDSNSVKASYNSNYSALDNINTMLTSGRYRTTVSKYSAISGIGFTTAPNDFVSQLNDDGAVTDIVVVGGGNDTSQEAGVIQTSVSQFVATAKSKYPKLKHIYYMWLAARLARPFWLKDHLLNSWINASNDNPDIVINVFDISKAASDLNVTLTTDDLHYNRDGQVRLYYAMVNCLFGSGYKEPSPRYLWSTTTNTLFYDSGTSAPLETQPQQYYLTWYPDGRLSMVFTLQKPIMLTTFDIVVTTHFLGVPDDFQYAMPGGFMRDIDSNLCISFGVEIITLGRETSKIRCYTNTASLISQSQNWRLFIDYPGYC